AERIARYHLRFFCAYLREQTPHRPRRCDTRESFRQDRAEVTQPTACYRVLWAETAPTVSRRDAERDGRTHRPPASGPGHVSPRWGFDSGWCDLLATCRPSGALHIGRLSPSE